MTRVLEWPLIEGETLCWQGRPAPRCYVFKRWLQALLGTLIFLASSLWLMVGYHLVSSQDITPWLLIIPLLLIIVAFGIGPGHILMARMRWEHIFYALSDQRLFVRSGRNGRLKIYSLAAYRGFQKRRYGKRQVSFRLKFSDEVPVVLECLEHSENFTACLPVIDDQVTGESV